MQMTSRHMCHLTQKDEEQALHQMESCLEEVRQWMAANWLKLNDSKTEFIAYGSKANLGKLTTNSITIGDAKVDRVDHVKSIGATFDSRMKMDKQVAAVSKTAWFHLYQISKVKPFLNEAQLKTVIHSYVINRLDQNNSLLAGLPKYSITKLQMVQNAAARLIHGARKRDHITPLLMDLHWLPIEKRIVFKILLLVYKSLHGKGPAYLSELLVRYDPPQSLRSSSMDLLYLPDRHYVDTKKRDFSFRGPVEWNLLPEKIKSCSSVAGFKSALKTYLFRQTYL